MYQRLLLSAALGCAALLSFPDTSHAQRGGWGGELRGTAPRGADDTGGRRRADGVEEVTSQAGGNAVRGLGRFGKPGAIFRLPGRGRVERLAVCRPTP